MIERRKKEIQATGKVLFVLYFIFLVYFLLLSDCYGRQSVGRDICFNLIPFKEIHRFWVYRKQLGLFAVFGNLFGNVLIFIPYGFLLPMASDDRSLFDTVFYSFCLSLCVEVIQLMMLIGSGDIDDLILNTLGGLVGYLIFSWCSRLRR